MKIMKFFKNLFSLLFFLRHKYVVCYKECGEKLSCSHICRKQCHIETLNQHKQCYVFVEKTIPECGHQIRIKCYETPIVINCKKTSLRQLACNHFADVPCCLLSSADGLKRYSCPKPCDTILACQHKCAGTCGDCRTGKLHIACDAKCDRELICAHVS